MFEFILVRVKRYDIISPLISYIQRHLTKAVKSVKIRLLKIREHSIITSRLGGGGLSIFRDAAGRKKEGDGWYFSVNVTSQSHNYQLPFFKSKSLSFNLILIPP